VSVLTFFFFKFVLILISAKNEETLPFVQAYENGLKEDDMLPILVEQEDVPMDNDDDDENTEPRESVSIHEIHKELRQKAREKVGQITI
jgi:hypothetical protein